MQRIFVRPAIAGPDPATGAARLDEQGRPRRKKVPDPATGELFAPEGGWTPYTTYVARRLLQGELEETAPPAWPPSPEEVQEVQEDAYAIAAPDVASAFHPLDHDGDGRPGGSLPKSRRSGRQPEPAEADPAG